MVICLEKGTALHIAQLMPLPLTVSCFSKTQICFTFLVPAHPGSLGQRAVKQVGVCDSNSGFSNSLPDWLASRRATRSALRPVVCKPRSVRADFRAATVSDDQLGCSPMMSTSSLPATSISSVPTSYSSPSFGSPSCSNSSADIATQNNREMYYQLNAVNDAKSATSEAPGISTEIRAHKPYNANPHYIIGSTKLLTCPKFHFQSQFSFRTKNDTYENRLMLYAGPSCTTKQIGYSQDRPANSRN